MKLIEMKCKNCGAELEVEDNQEEVTCKYCNTTFKIDDGKLRVDTDNMHEAGYQYEKGRIKARKEEEEEKENKIRQKELKDKYFWWWVIGWCCFFPIPLTILIWKSNWSQKKKIIVTVILWVVLIILGILTNSADNEQKKEKIISCYSEETYNKLDELVGIDNISGNFEKDEVCKNMNLKNSKYDKIIIDMDDDKNLISISIDGEYIYKNESLF